MLQYSSEDVTACLINVHSASSTGVLVTARFLGWVLFLLDQSEMDHHSVQWHRSLFLELLDSAVCCSLNVRNINILIYVIHFSLVIAAFALVMSLWEQSLAQIM
jgi:hypothetical protein